MGGWEGYGGTGGRDGDDGGRMVRVPQEYEKRVEEGRDGYGGIWVGMGVGEESQMRGKKNESVEGGRAGCGGWRVGAMRDGGRGEGKGALRCVPHRSQSVRNVSEC